VFELQKKNMLVNFQIIIELFMEKKVCFWDPGSKIQDPEKTYSRSRIPDPGSKRHRIRNTAVTLNFSKEN
jgi:hypothetical protein